MTKFVNAMNGLSMMCHKTNAFPELCKRGLGPLMVRGFVVMI